MTKHGDKMLMYCPDCDYTSDRMDNMTRHMQGEHGSKKMVSSLIDEILDSVINSAEDEKEVAVDEEEESPYLRARNERIAEIQVEFNRLFPRFEKEANELRVARKEKGKNRKKNPNFAVTARRSSRVVRSGVQGLHEGNLRGGEPVENHAGGEVVENLGGGQSESLENYAGGEMMENIGVGQSVEYLAGRESEENLAGGESEENLADGVESEEHIAVGMSEENIAGGVSEENVAGGESEKDQVGSSGDLFEGTEASNHPDLGQFGCLPCQLSFRDTSNLKRHVELVHMVRLETIKCPRPWCKAQFNILAEMRQHKIGCVKVCPYTDCLKTFTRGDKFAAHERGHIVMARRMAD